MAKLFKKKFLHEATSFKIVALVNTNGERTTIPGTRIIDFVGCSIVIAWNRWQGSIPHSRNIFVGSAKIGDEFVEETSRWPKT